MVSLIKRRIQILLSPGLLFFRTFRNASLACFVLSSCSQSTTLVVSRRCASWGKVLNLPASLVRLQGVGHIAGSGFCLLGSTFVGRDLGARGQ